MSMQVPFVGFQPIRTSEHMAAAGNLHCGLEWFIIFMFPSSSSSLLHCIIIIFTSYSVTSSSSPVAYIFVKSVVIHISLIACNSVANGLNNNFHFYLTY